MGALILAPAVQAGAGSEVRVTRGSISVPESRGDRPGGSGIADMTSPRFAPYRRWLTFADIIALDQRGTGVLSPLLSCPASFQPPPARTDTRASFSAGYRAVARRCADYWRGRGVRLEAYTTEASADDVADLARQLGYVHIRLFGASYGSHLGLSVIRRHPLLVERAVLGAVEGPDQTIKLPTAADAQLDRIGAAMRDDAATARVLPDFPTFVRELVRGADAAPLAVGTDRITGFDLRLLLGGMIGRRSEIEQLPALFDAITAFMEGSDTPDRTFDAPPLRFAPVQQETRP